MEKETTVETTVDTLEDVRKLIQSREGEFILRVEVGEGDGDGRKGQP